MKKIIEINAWELAAVAGGCHCYCFAEPYDRMNPTAKIGETDNEDACRLSCKARSLVYADCKSAIPRMWSTGKIPGEINSKIDELFGTFGLL